MYALMRMLWIENQKSVATVRSQGDVFQNISVAGALLLNTLQYNCTQNLKCSFSRG